MGALCQLQRRDIEIKGLLARSFDARASPDTVMGPVRAQLDLAASRGTCRCVTGTQTREVVRAAGPSLDERKRTTGEPGQVDTKESLAMLATRTSSPQLRLCWLVLPPECVFDDSEAWPFFHVQAGAFRPFKVGDHIFRLDNPLCKDADADG